MVRPFLLLLLLAMYASAQPALRSRASADSLIAALSADGNFGALIESARSLPADSLSARSHFHLGMAYAAVSDPQRAQESLRRALAMDSTRMAYRFQLARLLSQLGQYDEAIRHLERCIASDSTYIPAQYQLGLTLAAQRGEPEREMAVFQRILRRMPNDVPTLYALSESFKRAGLTDSAAHFLRRALDVQPRHLPSLIAYANALSARKSYGEALPLYQRADSLRAGNKDLLFQIGECFRRLDSLSDAKTFFRRAIALDSMNGLYHAQLAYTHFRAGEYDSSVTRYHTAIRYDEENAQYHLNLALVYATMGDTMMTMRSYEEAVRVMHPELAAAVYYDLGIYCFQKKRWRDGVRAFGRAIDIDPSRAAAYYFKGSCHMQLEEQAQALPLFTAFLTLSEGDESLKGERYSARKMAEYLRGLKKKK